MLNSLLIYFSSLYTLLVYFSSDMTKHLISSYLCIPHFLSFYCHAFFMLLRKTLFSIYVAEVHFYSYLLEYCHMWSTQFYLKLASFLTEFQLLHIFLEFTWLRPTFTAICCSINVMCVWLSLYSCERNQSVVFLWFCFYLLVYLGITINAWILRL